MAYINKEKFAEAICKFPAIDEDTANAVISLLHQQPAADVTEVNHGYWFDNIQKFTSPAGVTKDYLVGYKCSICGRQESVKEPYCNCGAKMDGKKG